jgi:hypothetical protein
VLVTRRRLRSARRFVSLLVLFAAASLAAGCSSGNVGDGASDDGTGAPVLVSAGTGGGKAGPKSHAGASSRAGAAAGGNAGLGGGAGSSGLGGSPAKAGAGGRGGSGGKGGAGGTAGITSSSGAMGFAGASASGGSAGSTTSGGTGGTDASAGTSGTSTNAGAAGTNAGAAGTNAGAGNSLTCGDGVIQAGEQCDDKGPSPQCSNSCVKVSDADCVTCENAATCVDSVNNCLGPEGGTPFTVDEQTECYAVMSCIISSKCFTVDGTLGGTCYCGSLSTSVCTAAPFDLTKPGAPDGPCAALIQAGMPGVTTNTAVIGNDLTKNTFPAGAAMQRLNCQKKADNAACAEACGYTVFPF